MSPSFRLLLCASTAALMLAGAPVAGFVAPAQAQVDVVVSAAIAPPPLPVYAQPPIPGLGYIWIPGYWARDGQEYYWVPGYWALPPAADLYWTPGYWAWDDADSDYVFYAGYWGPTVGYYGGIDYGYGYTGEGYHGGYWRNRQFFYNEAVNNLGGVRIANVYSQPVPAQPGGVAFHGGHGGTTIAPTPQQLALARAHHIGPTPAQMQHVQLARHTPALRFARNRGAPPIAATDRPGSFHGPHVVAAAGPGAHGGPAPQHVAGAAAGAVAGAAVAHGAMNRAPHFVHPPGPAARAATQHSPPPNAHLMARGPGGRKAMRAPHNFVAHGPTHGPTAARNFAARAPMHAPGPRNFASHGPMMHAPAMRHNFVHAPQIHAGGPAFAAARPGPMRLGGRPTGGPHMGGGHGFAGPPIGGMAGGPHLGGGFAGPRMGGMPHFGGMGGAPHLGGAPHIGGGPHMGGGPHGGPGPHVP